MMAQWSHCEQSRERDMLFILLLLFFIILLAIIIIIFRTISIPSKQIGLIEKPELY